MASGSRYGALATRASGQSTSTERIADVKPESRNSGVAVYQEATRRCARVERQFLYDGEEVVQIESGDAGGVVLRVLLDKYALFFFFSSRRRHTRCLSDWSSDVCSSD